jgi:hypothetical protein
MLEVQNSSFIDTSKLRDSFPVIALNGSRFFSWLDTSVFILRSNTFELLTQIKTNHSAKIINAVLIPNNASNSNEIEHMVITSSDGTCQVFNIRTGEMLTDFKGHKGPPYILTALDDGLQVVSVSFSRTNKETQILLWNSRNGELVQDLSSLHTNISKIEQITSKRVSSSGDFFIVAKMGDKMYVFKSNDPVKIQFEYIGVLALGKGPVTRMGWVSRKNEDHKTKFYDFMALLDGDCSILIHENSLLTNKNATRVFKVSKGKEIIQSATIVDLENQNKKLIAIEIMDINTKMARIMMVTFKTPLDGSNSSGETFEVIAQFDLGDKQLTGLMAVNSKNPFESGDLFLHI